MSYGNDYSNKPFERASKVAHTYIINDPDVKEFLSQCKIPPFEEEVDKEDVKGMVLEDIKDNLIKNIITIDGGYTNVVVKEEFPSSTIAFFQFGALFFKYSDLINLKEKPFIDPDDFSKLQNIQRLKLVLPTKGLCLTGEKDLITSVRRSIYNFFMKNPEKQGFMNALKWLVFEEYEENSNPVWHLASCPYCDKEFDIAKNNIKPDFTLNCPYCGGIVFLTDVFRLHEAMDNELGAGGILGYLTTAIEQLIIVYLIKQILNVKPGLLKETIFIKDGPLAFFGQTANIHKPMRELIRFLQSNHDIYLVGLEKSGSFVDHACQISQTLAKNQVLLLGNKYIYKYIIPGNGDVDEIYGRSTYYGHKLIFKSKYDNVYVATIPSLEAKLEPEKSDYLNETVPKFV